MVWVIAFGELFFGDLWCVVWGYGGMRTHFSLLNPELTVRASQRWLALTFLGFFRRESSPQDLTHFAPPRVPTFPHLAIGMEEFLSAVVVGISESLALVKQNCRSTH